MYYSRYKGHMYIYIRQIEGHALMEKCAMLMGVTNKVTIITHIRLKIGELVLSRITMLFVTSIMNFQM